MNFNTFYLDKLNGSDQSLGLGYKKSNPSAYGFADIIKVCENENSQANASNPLAVQTESMLNDVESANDNTLHLSEENLSELSQLISQFLSNAGNANSANEVAQKFDSISVSKKQLLLSKADLNNLLSGLIEKVAKQNPDALTKSVNPNLTVNDTLTDKVSELTKSLVDSITENKSLNLAFKSGSQKLSLNITLLPAQKDNSTKTVNDAAEGGNLQNLFAVSLSNSGKNELEAPVNIDAPSANDLNSGKIDKSKKISSPVYNTEIIQIVFQNLPSQTAAGFNAQTQEGKVAVETNQNKFYDVNSVPEAQSSAQEKLGSTFKEESNSQNHSSNIKIDFADLSVKENTQAISQVPNSDPIKPDAKKIISSKPESLAPMPSDSNQILFKAEINSPFELVNDSQKNTVINYSADKTQPKPTVDSKPNGLADQSPSTGAKEALTDSSTNTLEFLKNLNLVVTKNSADSYVSKNIELPQLKSLLQTKVPETKATVEPANILSSVKTNDTGKELFEITKLFASLKVSSVQSESGFTNVPVEKVHNITAKQNFQPVIESKSNETVVTNSSDSIPLLQGEVKSQAAPFQPALDIQFEKSEMKVSSKTETEIPKAKITGKQSNVEDTASHASTNKTQSAKSSLQDQSNEALKEDVTSEPMVKNNTAAVASDPKMNYKKTENESAKEDSDNKIVINTGDDSNSTGSVKEVQSKSSGEKDTAKQGNEEKNNFIQNLNELKDIGADKIKNSFELKSQSETPKTIKASEIISEFSKFIQSNSDKQSISFQLSPDNLGKVKLVIDLIQNHVNTHIEVENEQVKQFIQQNVEQLKTNLQSSGIQLNTVNISLANHEQNAGKQNASSKKYSKVARIRDEKTETGRRTKSLGYNTYEFLA